MATPLAAAPARPRPVVAVSGRSVVEYLSVLLPLTLVLLVIQQYRLENRTFFAVAVLTVAGFAVHALLPLARRLPFFVALSVAGFAVALSPGDAAWLLAVGLALIGICHLPLAHRWRVAILLVVGCVLALGRAGVMPTPWSGAVWPVLGSIFMFRLALYLHALKHGQVERRRARTLAYFFMLPNVSFALFPVVDYETFQRNYYDDDAWAIYRTGLLWIARGVVQLILYRMVYLNFTLDASQVTSVGALLQFMVTTYLLYLRVSGQFHLIAGVLHLFGFRLPETHHLYYLASGFTDFWRRINIYWKDFMMKLVYYPSFFRLRRYGNQRAIVLATAVVFVTTWLLHSYQWFWLRGGFPLTVPDTLFWGILGACVIVASLREAGRPRRRSLSKPPAWSASLAGRTVLTFCVLCVLWSLWSADSVVAWLWMWRDGMHATPRELATLGALLAVAFAASGRAWGTAKPPARPAFHQRIPVRVSVTMAGLLVLAQPPVQRAVAPARELLASLRSPGLNSVDAQLQVRGYYEQLDQRGAINGQTLWEASAQKPATWTELSTANVIRDRADFLVSDLRPSYRFEWNGHPTTTNQWGMRDREYPLAKPAGTFRIAVLGPSLTMGNMVDDDEPYAKVLEARLARQPIGDRRRVEVLNFGINGYSIAQQVALLEERVLPFQPDLVIVSEAPYIRDGVTRFLLRVVWGGRPVPDPGLRRLLAGAELQPMDTTGRALPFAVARRAVGAFGLDTRMTWDESRARVRSLSAAVVDWSARRLADSIRAHGAVPMALAIAPVDPLPRDPDLWLRAAGRAGFLTVDLLHALDRPDRAALRVAPWDNHPNAAGHRIIADRLYDALRAHAREVGLLGAPTPASAVTLSGSPRRVTP